LRRSSPHFTAVDAALLPVVYFGMSLGLTFPFNIVLGIPLYLQSAQSLLG